MKTSLVRGMSAALAAIFAAVGWLFLLLPNVPVRFLNGLGRGFGLPEAPLSGAGFYLGLAASYMYVVTVLAWKMFRQPATSAYPLLLAHAKAASSLLSFGLFLFHRSFFIFLANGIIDFGLAALALLIYFDRRKAEKAIP